MLILSSHLHLGLPNGLFPSGFPTNTLCTPLLYLLRLNLIWYVYCMRKYLFVETFRCHAHFCSDTLWLMSWYSSLYHTEPGGFCCALGLAIRVPTEGCEGMYTGIWSVPNHCVSLYLQCEAICTARLCGEAGHSSVVQWHESTGATTATVGRSSYRHAQAAPRRILCFHGTATGCWHCTSLSVSKSLCL